MHSYVNLYVVLSGFKSDTDMDSDMHYLTTSSTELGNFIRREEKKLHAAYVFRDLAVACFPCLSPKVLDAIVPIFWSF